MRGGRACRGNILKIALLIYMVAAYVLTVAALLPKIGWAAFVCALAIPTGMYLTFRWFFGRDGPVAALVPPPLPNVPAAEAPTMGELALVLKKQIDGGATLAVALGGLKAEGVSTLKAMGAIRIALGCDMSQALDILHEHPAWRESAENVRKSTDAFFAAMPNACEYETADGRRHVSATFPLNAADCAVTFTDKSAVLTHPRGERFEVPWDELQRVVVATTGEGPFLEDVWFRLEGLHGVCAVPQGAAGSKELLARLQRLEGFDNETLITAMGCAEDRRFVVWERA